MEVLDNRAAVEICFDYINLSMWPELKGGTSCHLLAWCGLEEILRKWLVQGERHLVNKLRLVIVIDIQNTIFLRYTTIRGQHKR